MSTESKSNSISEGEYDEAYSDPGKVESFEFEIQPGADISELKRWGFMQAIKNRYEGDCDPDILLEVYRKKVYQEIERIDSLYQMSRTRIEEKIKTLKTRIEELKQQKEQIDPLAEELTKKKESIEKDLNEIRSRILEIRRRMASAKEDMLDKWLDKAGHQLKKALDLQKQVYEETIAVNEKRFSDGKAVFSQYRQQFLEKRKLMQDRFDVIQEQMKRLGMEGVSTVVGNWVLGIGTSVAAAAGYFFSIFTSTTQLGNNDALSYFLTGLMKAAGMNNPGFAGKILFIIGFVLGLIALSAGCHYLINRIIIAGKESKEENEFSFLTTGKIIQEQQKAGVRLKAGNWMIFWLQITPLVIILGVILALLGLSDQEGRGVAGLNNSMEGLLAGTAIAMGVGAMVYLYIIKIIEPRIQRQTETSNTEKRKWFRYYELVILVFVFVICTLLMIFISPDKNGLPDWFKSTIAITEFIAVALMGGIAIGYGLRFRGLFGMNQYLQGQINRYDSLIAELSAPVLPAGGSDLSYSLKTMLEQVLAATADRAYLLRNKVPPSSRNLPQTTLPGVEYAAKKGSGMNDPIAWLSRFFRWRKQEPPSAITSLIELSDWERRYFPDLDEEIKVLGFEYSEGETEIRRIESKLESLAAENEGNEDERQRDIRNQEMHIESLLTRLEHISADHLRKRAGVEQNIFRSETAILEGYHLAIWYREAQMGATPDYYRKGNDPLGFFKKTNQPKLLTYGAEY